jgi:hypothetical protein
LHWQTLRRLQLAASPVAPQLRQGSGAAPTRRASASRHAPPFQRWPPCLRGGWLTLLNQLPVLHQRRLLSMGRWAFQYGSVQTWARSGWGSGARSLSRYAKAILHMPNAKIKQEAAPILGIVIELISRQLPCVHLYSTIACDLRPRFSFPLTMKLFLHFTLITAVQAVRLSLEETINLMAREIAQSPPRQSQPRPPTPYELIFNKTLVSNT